MRQIRLSEQIIPKYQTIFTTSKKHIILTSGRAGTKSSAAALLCIWTIIQSMPGSVVVMRKHHNKLRKTVYSEILRAITRLGMKKSQFIITVSPMQVTYKKTGNSILFSGSDSIDDTKGLIDEGRPIRLVMLDELTEFFDQGEGEDELQNIEATFVRGNAGGFRMLYCFNPPKNPHSPICVWTEKMEQRPDTVHIHADYLDVPPQWLGEDLIQSARIMEQFDPRQYAWVWLGESIGIDEVIYYMFSRSKHVREPTAERYGIGIVGVDYGQQNATTFQIWGINEDARTLEGLDEFYHSGRTSGQQRPPSEYAAELIKLTDRISNKYSTVDFYLFIDPSAAGLSEEIKRTARTHDINYRIHIKDAENAVSLGIGRVQDALTYGALTFSPRQKGLLQEIVKYEYDKKSIENGKERPVKTDDHAMDAMRYAVMGSWVRIKRYIEARQQEALDA